MDHLLKMQIMNQNQINAHNVISFNTFFDEATGERLYDEVPYHPIEESVTEESNDGERSIEDAEYFDRACCLEDKPRTLNEMHEATEKLWKQVWYNRHMNLRYWVEEGDIKIVTKAEWREKKYDELKYPECQNYMTEEIWNMALNAAERTKAALGEENIGPWTDFEWGMLNGKLSALRWALGNDWDFLDT